MLIKKRLLKNFEKFTGKHLCQGLFLTKVTGLRPVACKFIKKDTPTRAFPCEYSDIFKNRFLKSTTPVAASVNNENLEVKRQPWYKD